MNCCCMPSAHATICCLQRACIVKTIIGRQTGKLSLKIDWKMCKSRRGIPQCLGREGSITYTTYRAGLQGVANKTMRGISVMWVGWIGLIGFSSLRSYRLYIALKISKVMFINKRSTYQYILCYFNAL